MLFDPGRARATLAGHGLDGLLALGAAHVTYLTGYDSWTIYTFDRLEVYGLRTADGDGALVAPIDAIDYLAQRPAEVDRLYTYGTFHIHRADDAVLDGAEAEVARLRAQAPHHPDALTALGAALVDLGLAGGVVGADQLFVSGARWQRLADADLAVQLRGADDILADLRRVKTEPEIDRLRHAARAVEDAIQEAFDSARIGTTEADLARVIAAATARRDVTPGHCETSIGTRGAACFPPSPQRGVAAGDVIRSDCGGRYRGYWADTGRTAALGDPPAALARCFEAISVGIEAMLAQVRPGIAVEDLFRVGVDTVRDHGIGHYRRHHAGHAIGLEMYEPPIVVGAAGSADIYSREGAAEVLEPGMVLNLELPYYELGLGGVQIEETLVVREQGYELLTAAPRGLRRLEPR